MIQDLAQMADVAEDYEEELSKQLQEQRVALQEIEAAIATDPSEELDAVKDQLVAAIEETEEALLTVKKSKLLALVSNYEADRITGNAKEEHGNAASAMQPSNVTADASLPSTSEPPLYGIGAACRFQFTDGRWYNGQVVSSEQGNQVHVAFCAPTKGFMLPGVILPQAALRPPRSTAQHATRRTGIIVGSRVYAKGVPGAADMQLWELVEVSMLDELSGLATVSYESGASATLHVEDLLPTPWAEASDLETEDTSKGSSGSASSNDGGDSSSGEEEMDEEEERPGLGDVLGHARLAVEAGVHAGSVHFAEWESHSRGIASKLLASMGYVKGTGLGREGEGINAPLEVLLLPTRRGLGGANKHGADEEGGSAAHQEGGKCKRKRRGGERSRQKRHAAEARRQREQRKDEQQQLELQGDAPGLFAFINNALGDKSEAAAKIKAVESVLLKQQPGLQAGSTAAAPAAAAVAAAGGSSSAGRRDNRQQLISMQEEITSIQSRVQHFRGMLERNKGNKALAVQISARLQDVMQELADAQAEQARMSKAISSSEAQKRFLKF